MVNYVKHVNQLGKVMKVINNDLGQFKLILADYQENQTRVK